MDHKNEHDFVSPPYPPIDPKPNPHYAQILMEDYAGIVSELTAITKYEYQSVVLMNTFPHFAKELSKIGMAEMHHLHILAQLIFKLGGDPRYRAHSNPTMGHLWSGQNVDYQCDFPSLIYENIQGEKQAIENYRRHLCLIQDSSVQKNIRRIILDEEHHIRIFCQALALWQRGALS